MGWAVDPVGRQYTPQPAAVQPPKKRPVDNVTPATPAPFATPRRLVPTANVVAASESQAIDGVALVRIGAAEMNAAAVAALARAGGPAISEGLARAALDAKSDGRRAMLAVAAVNATDDVSALLERLGPEATSALVRSLGLDRARWLAVSRSTTPGVDDVPASVRVRAAERLVRTADETVLATVFATFDPRALRLRYGDLAGALAASLASKWGEADPSRMAALFADRRGQRLFFAREAPETARLMMLQLFRHDRSLTLDRLTATNPWLDPVVTKAAFAARAADFEAIRGDDPTTLEGTDLENTIGAALRLPPLVSTDAALARANEAAAAEGRHSYFDTSAVGPIAAQLRRLGGEPPAVTVLPIQFSSPSTGVVQLVLFRVGERFVDNTGRAYESFEDWKANNVLPPGHMTFPSNGHLGSIDGAATPRTVDTTGERIVEALDAAALVGGTIAGGAVILGSGGSAAPAVATIAGLWVAGRSAGTLADRATHGQTIDPTASSEARAAWLNVAAGAVGGGAVAGGFAARIAAAGTRAHAIARAGATAMNLGALGLDAGAAFEAGLTLAEDWDRLPPSQRAQLLLSVGFWLVQTGVQIKTRPFAVASRLETIAASKETPSQQTARELRTKGFRDTVGMSGEPSLTAKAPHLRAIARGQALAEALGGEMLRRIRALFEPSAALRREKAAIEAQMQALWQNEGAALSRALATPEASRRTDAQALVDRFDRLSAQQSKVGRKITKDLRRRLADRQDQAAEMMATFLTKLRATGVGRARASEMASKVELTPRAKAALEKAGVGEEKIREWLTDFFMITTKTRSPEELKIDIDAKRACYIDRCGTIDLGSNFGSNNPTRQKQILFHELAHSIEYAHPPVGEAARLWVRQRATAAGEQSTRALNELDSGSAYDADEVAFEDHFLHPYVGKVYGDGRATEVTSTALERFADVASLTELFTKDPEQFLLLTGLLR